MTATPLALGDPGIGRSPADRLSTMDPDSGALVNVLVRARETGQAAESPRPAGPALAAELVADLGQPGGARRLGDPATVVLAACQSGHASPAHPGPVEMLETAAGWTLSGTRWAVLNPTMADTTRLLLPLSIDDGRLSLALVPASRPGVSLRPLGQAGQGTAPVPHEVLLRKVLVQPQDLIGAAGAAGAEYAGAVARARLTLAAHLVGVGQGALRVAAERAADRRQFGRPIAANQSVGHALASAYIEVEAAWLLIRRIVDDVRAEGWSPRVRAESAGATALAASVAGSATRLAVHVHGASGLVSTAPVQRYLQAARAEPAGLGTIAVLRREAATRVARAASGPAPIAAGWKAGPGDPPPAARSAAFEPVYRLVERQARRTRSAIALSGGPRQVTYRHLNASANRLALALRQRGVGPDVPVGVCLERSVELVVAVLAVLKAGGAYVPLDPAHPPARLAAMVDDCRPALVVTQEWMREWLPAGFPLICLDTEEYHAGTAADLPGTPHPANLMYIMYTSGSTGSPKGVEVTHGGIANRLAWDRRHVPLGPADAVLQLTSPGFDPFGWEVFASLSSGARLVLLPPGGHRDPQEVLRTIVAEEVTAITLIPAQLALLMDQRPGLLDCPSLRYVFCGGDVLAPSLAAAFPVDGRPALYNMYGPTETSIDATAWRCDGRIAATVPIGERIDGVQVHLLDDRMSPVPAGEPGDLWVSGAGLARGYHLRPAATAASFRPDPAADRGGRIYHTGDRARRAPGEPLEFLGRTDRQVKVRGHRVELEEIEAELRRLPEVRAAVAVAHDDRLIAFVVTEPADTNPVGLRARLRTQLPEQLVPARLVTLAHLPQTPAGKIDHAALRALAAGPVADLRASPGGSASPEQALARLYAELLGLREVTPDDDFFALGGDSLRAARLVTRARTDLGLPVTLDQLVRAPSARALATVVTGTRQPSGHGPVTADGDRPAVLAPAVGTLALVCLPSAGGTAGSYGGWQRFLPAGADLRPVDYPDLCTDMPTLLTALEAILQPLADRPLVLLGTSFGALVAFELALRMRDRGVHPKRLAVLACPAPPQVGPSGTAPLDLLCRLHPGAEPDLLSALARRVGAGLALADTYRYHPGRVLDCPISAFGGLYDPVVHRDQMGSWASMTTGAFRLRMLPGSHQLPEQAAPYVVRGLCRDLGG